MEKNNKEIKNCPMEIGNDIWNAAIEEAAQIVQNEMGNLDDTFLIVKKIRSLKK